MSLIPESLREKNIHKGRILITKVYCEMYVDGNKGFWRIDKKLINDIAIIQKVFGADNFYTEGRDCLWRSPFKEITTAELAWLSIYLSIENESSMWFEETIDLVEGGSELIKDTAVLIALSM
jgi:hypothetical protein